MENKTRFFSRKDGTTLPQDLEKFIEGKLHDIKKLLHKFGEDAEKIVGVLRKIDAEIQAGTPTDLIIQKALVIIPGHADEAIYKFIRDHLGEFIDEADMFVKSIQSGGVGEIHLPEVLSNYESLRHKKASTILELWVNENFGGISRAESDTTVQNVYLMTL